MGGQDLVTEIGRKRDHAALSQTQQQPEYHQQGENGTANGKVADDDFLSAGGN